MSEIEALDPRMIERYLRDQELRFLTNQDGAFVVHFYGDDVPDYGFWISVEGRDHDFLDVRVMTDIPLTTNIRQPAEAFVSGWNRFKRWPKAYLEDDDQRGRGFWIVGENCFTLTAGIHQPLFDELLTVSLTTGRQLVRESSAALAGVDKFENWLSEAG